jgi:hypothetical protein
MIQLSANKFLKYMVLAFIFCIFIDLLLVEIGLERSISSIVSYIALSLCFTYILYARLQCTSADNRLALMGLLGPVGFLFGIYVFWKFD